MLPPRIIPGNPFYYHNISPQKGWICHLWAQRLKVFIREGSQSLGIIDYQWEPTVKNREFSLIICDDLNGKEIQKRGNVCICIADSWWLKWAGICMQCRRPRFDPWVGEIPWRREWLPIPVFLPRECHGQRSLVGCHLWSCTESDTTEVT